MDLPLASPLEPEVIIQQPPSWSISERPDKSKGDLKRKRKKSSPQSKKSSSVQGESKSIGTGSAAPSSTPLWPSPGQHPPADKPSPYIFMILEELQRMQARMDGFEANQFRGFSPKKSSRGQQTSDTLPPPSKDKGSHSNSST